MIQATLIIPTLAINKIYYLQMLENLFFSVDFQAQKVCNSFEKIPVNMYKKKLNINC